MNLVEQRQRVVGYFDHWQGNPKSCQKHVECFPTERKDRRIDVVGKNGLGEQRQIDGRAIAQKSPLSLVDIVGCSEETSAGGSPLSSFGALDVFALEEKKLCKQR